MRKPKKAHGNILSFSVARWATLNEAFARAKAVLSSSALAERDLLADMRTKRLPSAMRIARDDGTETFERLKPSFWRDPKLSAYSGNVVVHHLDVKFITGECWFFVERSALDKLYPVGGVAASAKSNADFSNDDDEATTLPPPRRKPGPQPRHDWPLFVASELIRRAKAGEKEPTAAAMIEHCETHLKWSPGLKEMQVLLKKLLRRRRF